MVKYDLVYLPFFHDISQYQSVCVFSKLEQTLHCLIHLLQHLRVFTAFSAQIRFCELCIMKLSNSVSVCVCVCVCVSVCVCLRPFTVKASSAWISWDTREQIKEIMLKTLISYAKSRHRYFRMLLLTFLTSHFILFAH